MPPTAKGPIKCADPHCRGSIFWSPEDKWFYCLLAQRKPGHVPQELLDLERERPLTEEDVRQQQAAKREWRELAKPEPERAAE